MMAAGCFYSNALGGLKCYENPKDKVTAVPANEEEICGATFKVKITKNGLIARRKNEFYRQIELHQSRSIFERISHVALCAGLGKSEQKVEILLHLASN
jgi:hypothetical protein